MRRVNSVLIGCLSLGLSLSACSRKPQVASSDENVPRDEKGIVGSPFASNINRSSPGEPQVGEAHGVPAGNPAVQPKTTEGPPNFGSGPQAAQAAREKLDIDKYSYQQRDQFKAAVSQRLDAIDRAITKTKKSGELKQIQKEHDKIASRLQSIDGVPPDQWNQTKESFRNQIVSLERDFASYSAAQR